MDHPIASPSKINRRDFLKLTGLGLLGTLGLHRFAIPIAGRPTYPNRQALSVLHTRQSSPPNILVVVFDTLTACNMSLYGYPRLTTPNMDRLAERAVIYHHHYAAANFTTPGTASLLSGLYPWEHGALHMHGCASPAVATRNLFSLLPGYFHLAYTHNPMAYILLQQYRNQIDQLLPVAEWMLYSASPAGRLFDQDYRAAYEAELLMFRNGYHPSGSLFIGFFERISRHFRGNSLNSEWLTEFPRGLPQYYDEELPGFLFFTVEQAFNQLIETLPKIPRPFLSYIHLLPPHGPHNPSKEFSQSFQDSWEPPEKPDHHFSMGLSQTELNRLRTQYDQSIAYVDAEFGRLFTALESKGILENTWIFVTSDHGELFERGIYSHITPVLYEPLLHIPLLVFPPGHTVRQDIHTPTSAIDLLHTMMDIAGQPVSFRSEGQVLPGLSFPAAPAPRNLFAFEAKESPLASPFQIASAAFIQEQYKLIYYTGYPGFSNIYELYDLQNDPQELENLYSATNPQAVSMQEQLLATLK